MSFQAGTATLVPCITNANLATSLFAPAGSGGGGGGGGAELEISTILFGPGQFGLGILDVTNPTTLAINNNATAATNDIVFTTNNDQLDTPCNFIEINSPDAANSVQILAQDNGNNGLISQQGGLLFGAASTISIQANDVAIFSPTSISSLTVSSINGAAPGGGSVGPDLNLSTLNIANVISVEDGVAYGSVGDVILSSQKAGSAVRIWVSTTSYTAEGANGTNLAIYNPGGNPIAESLNLVSQVGGPAVIRCDAGVRFQAPSVAISSFTVSTINGAEYPPSSSAFPKVSTIGLGGGGSQTVYDSISTNSFAQFTTPFDVVQNHCYEVSWNYNLKPSSAAQFTDYATFATTGLNAGTQAVVVPLAVSTLTQSRIFFIGQNTGQTYLACSTETSFPVELDLNYSTENVNLIDFGPIATSF